jgi:hypothetical protein
MLSKQIYSSKKFHVAGFLVIGNQLVEIGNPMGGNPKFEAIGLNGRLLFLLM